MPHSSSPISREERVRGALLGLLVGDALGVPYEFTAPEELPPMASLEMTPPSDFRRAHRSVPAGTWSDDGAQALCLLASLLDKGHLDLDDFAARLLAWYERGAYAVDGRVFDVGVQTSTALRALMGGASPRESGPALEKHNGNGSLMRVMPLALWHRGSDRELVRDAYDQSIVTHGHARSKVCCALYCLWSRAILEERQDPWRHATRSMRSMLARGSAEEEALELHVRPDEAAQGKGSGYVVDTLRSARMVLDEGGSVEVTLKRAVALGHDTDTTACVVGGIVGARDGASAIPERWRTALRGQEILEPLLEALLRRG